jgi:sugar phosphate isomerase/epimerase
MSKSNISIAIKCAPEKAVLDAAQRAGIEAVELYLTSGMLTNLKYIIHLCQEYPFQYAVHAPSYGYHPKPLADLVKALAACVVVFHNIYWEDEWKEIVEKFKQSKTRLCIENTYSIHEPLKFMRKLGFGRCLDLEHLEVECAGVYEEEFIPVIREAVHIHLTGYIYGSKLWHTHLHHSPEHSVYMLNLLKVAGYSGFVVSEARTEFQNFREFKRLVRFFEAWEKCSL